MIAIMQPTLFPWLGYFDLMDQSKTFILYNDVQFVKRSWQSRNRIATANGILQITIPTVKCAQLTKIEDVLLEKGNSWNKNLKKTLLHNYSNAKHFKLVMDWINGFLEKDFIKLQDFHYTFIREISNKIGIKTPIKFSSEISINSTDRVNKFIEYCKIHDASAYLSPTGSFGYLDEENAIERFNKNNIEIVFHNYEPCPYETGKIQYEPYMSVIDVLFHCGFDETLAIIRNGRKPNFTFEEFKIIQDAK